MREFRGGTQGYLFGISITIIVISIIIAHRMLLDVYVHKIAFVKKKKKSLAVSTLTQEGINDCFRKRHRLHYCSLCSFKAAQAGPGAAVVEDETRARPEIKHLSCV